MMSFSEDIDFARLTMARISSYSVSLLDTRKSNRIAYSILSPVRALSCKPTPAPVWREVTSTLRTYQPALPWSTSSWGSSAKKSTNTYPSMLGKVYTKYRIHLVQSPTGLSFLIGQACV